MNPTLTQEDVRQHMDAAKAFRLAWLATLIPETGNGIVPLFYRAPPLPGEPPILEACPFLVVAIDEGGQVTLAYQYKGDARGFSMWTHHSLMCALSAEHAILVQEHMVKAVQDPKIARLWPSLSVQIWGRDTLARFLVEVARPQGEALKAFLGLED